MTVLAHTGGFGWDEALFLVVPVVVLLLLSRQARKKAEEQGTEGEGDTVANSPNDPGDQG